MASQDRRYCTVALELAAFGLGYLAGVSFMAGFALVATAKATGSIYVAMLLAPVLLWSTSWLYFQAFEGAKEMLRAARNWQLAPRRPAPVLAPARIKRRR